MANPVSSIMVSIEQVPEYVATEDSPGTVQDGVFTGIPIIASIEHLTIKPTGYTGYAIHFDIDQMRARAAAAMGLNVSDVYVSFTDDTLYLSTEDSD